MLTICKSAPVEKELDLYMPGGAPLSGVRRASSEYRRSDYLGYPAEPKCSRVCPYMVIHNRRSTPWSKSGLLLNRRIRFSGVQPWRLQPQGLPRAEASICPLSWYDQYLGNGKPLLLPEEHFGNEAVLNGEIHAYLVWCLPLMVTTFACPFHGAICPFSLYSLQAAIILEALKRNGLRSIGNVLPASSSVCTKKLTNRPNERIE